MRAASSSVKFLCSDLVREIQISEDFASRPDRHSEEGFHRWMVGGEPIAAGVGAKIAQSQRCGIGDQEAEDATTGRPKSDGPLVRLAQTGGQKLFKPRPISIEHAEGSVLGLNQRPCLFDQVT